MLKGKVPVFFDYALKRALASYMINKCEKDGIDMWPSKIHHLVYFTYAWTLAEYDIELFIVYASKQGPYLGDKIDRYIKRRLEATK